jgi:hypothetical protein
VNISKRVRFRVFTRDDFTCQYCGRRAPDVVLHVDHVTARANGGTDAMSNLLTACADCNLGKSTELVPPMRSARTWDGFPVEWMAPDFDDLQVALCDPAFYPELVV